MKKQSFILLILLLCSGLLFAQTEKGKFFLAGYSNLGLDIGKNKTKVGSTSSDNFKYFEFFINPEAGYFVADNLMTGAFMDFSFENYKNENDTKENYTTFIIGPNVRYYFLKLDKFMPYGEARLGIGLSNYKYTPSSGDANTSKDTYFTTRIGVGGTYFLVDNLGLDVFAGYDYDAWTNKDDTSGGVKSAASSDKTTNSYGSVEVNVGLVLVF